jgi:hypothetical protein
MIIHNTIKNNVKKIEHNLLNFDKKIKKDFKNENKRTFCMSLIYMGCEFYRIIVSTLLLLFVTQYCQDDVQCTINEYCGTNNQCTVSEYCGNGGTCSMNQIIDNQSIFYRTVLVFNFFTFLSYIILYIIEIKNYIFRC